MKKIIYPFLLLLCACGTKMTAVEYHAAITDEHDKIENLMNEMSRHVESDLAKADILRDSVIKQAQKSRVVVEKMPDYKGNTAYRDATVELFKFYEDITSKHFKEMFGILKKSDDGTQEKDGIRLREIQEDLAKRGSKMDTKFQKAQQEFAQENSINAEQNPPQG